jgi:hypothetical protein
MLAIMRCTAAKKVDRRFLLCKVTTDDIEIRTTRTARATKAPCCPSVRTPGRSQSKTSASAERDGRCSRDCTRVIIDTGRNPDLSGGFTAIALTQNINAATRSMDHRLAACRVGAAARPRQSLWISTPGGVRYQLLLLLSSRTPGVGPQAGCCCINGTRGNGVGRYPPVGCRHP